MSLNRQRPFATACCCMAVAAATPAMAQSGPSWSRLQVGGFAVYPGIAMSHGGGLFTDMLLPANERPDSYIRVGINLRGEQYLDGTVLLTRPTSDVRVTFDARISDFELRNFFGYGNDSRLNSGASTTNPEYYTVDNISYRAGPTMRAHLGGGLSMTVGTYLDFNITDQDDPAKEPNEAANFLFVRSPMGTGRFAHTGIQTGFDYEIGNVYRRVRAATSASLNLPLLRHSRPFMKTAIETEGEFSFAGRLAPFVAFSGRFERVIGDAPFQEAAYLGGSSLRGVPSDRFAGDAVYAGSVEAGIQLRSLQTPAGALDVGVFGLRDAGRVSYQGASPGGWHSATGLGVWVRPAWTATRMSITAANSGYGTRFRLEFNSSL